MHLISMGCKECATAFRDHAKGQPKTRPAFADP
jgi:hypothetical protein